MRKYIFLLLISTFLMTSIINAVAQSKAKSTKDTTEEESYYDEDYKGSDIIKEIFIDAGWGSEKLGIGLGFRYWNLGASFGITGLGVKLPNYDNSTYINKTEAVITEKYSTIAVTTDLYYFYDINETYTVFANFGYSAGSDTILAKKANSTDNKWYRWGSESNSEFTFGLGGQYFFEKWIALGLGYHSRRGIYAQFVYYWY